MLTDRVSSGAAIPFDPTTPEQRENPFDVLALARREQPVFHAPALDLWVVTRHDDVLAVLKDHRTFSSTGALKSSSAQLPAEVLEVLADGHPEMPYIIELDPPLHDRIRGLVARAFTPRRIDGLAPRIEEIASELIDELAPRGRADIVEAFACGTAAVVTPIAVLRNADIDIRMPDVADADRVSLSLREELTGIQYGRVEDRHGWMLRLDA